LDQLRYGSGYDLLTTWWHARAILKLLDIII
jgi:hypothetical protein